HMIVCTEPAAAVCLREEYPMILDHPDVDLIAGQVIEAGDYLKRLHAEGALRTDFQPLTMTAGYHLPCHVEALSHASPFAELLALAYGLMPELRERLKPGRKRLVAT